MAKQYWPQGDGIAKEVRLPDMKSEPRFVVMAKDSDSWLKIIGIAARTPWISRQVLVRTQTAPLANLKSHPRRAIA
jgi:hypothetical protein